MDRYLEVADAVQADIDTIETDMFTPRGWRSIDRVYQLKREVLELKRAVAPLTGPMRTLSTLRHPLIADETRNYFRDVDDHLLRVKEQVISFDELLSSILQAGLAQVQVAENEDMRRISAWVAILAVPTVIAGIYGMNFDYMPELRIKYAYFVDPRRDADRVHRALPAVQAKPLALSPDVHYRLMGRLATLCHGRESRSFGMFQRLWIEQRP